VLTPTFSIVIPLYNEEACVEKCTVEIVRGLDRDFAGAYELILVINGSRDRTPEICERLAGMYACIRTVAVPHNLGYGGGIITGLRAARGEYVGFMCGDGQISPEDLARVMHAVAEDDADLVKARRITRGDGLVRKLNSLVYNTLFRLVLGTRTRDINAMPKMWHRRTAPLVDPVSTDWFIDAEIMIKARYRGLRVREIPVHYLERAGGRSVVRVSTVFQFLRNAAATVTSGRLAEWKRPPGAKAER
jgi:glycosyltransferase involved in cell wall biosynthesis